jgi:hypothetical protein
MTTDHPVEQVERLDALNCNLTATDRIGDRLTCATHKLEVARALWNADARQPMFNVDEAEAREDNLKCGGTYAARVVAA